MNNLNKRVASLVSATTLLLVAGSSTVFAQTVTGSGGCNVQVNSALVDTADIQTCNSGATGVSPLAALGAFLGIGTPAAPAPAGPAPAGPTSGKAVGVSGTVAVDTTVNVPGGPSLNVAGGTSAAAGISNPFSTAPVQVGGVGAGGGVAQAGSVGNGTGDAAGGGSGNSFNNSALSGATAASTAEGAGPAAGIGVAGGTGFSGGNN